MRFVAFQVLVFIVENDVATSDGFTGVVVVLDVVGFEMQAAIVDFHVAIREVLATLAALGTVGGDGGNFSGARRQMDLLRESGYGEKKPRENGEEETAAGSAGNLGCRCLHAAFKLNESNG